MPLLASTPIRRAREWFSSWPGLPRSFEEDSYGIPEETRIESREREKDTGTGQRRKTVKQSGGGKEDQRIKT